MGGWAVALSGFAGQGCCTVAASFSKGQKECFQSSPSGQDIIWSKCGGETFDIFRNASLFSSGCLTGTHTLRHSFSFEHGEHKFAENVIAVIKHSAAVLSPFI